MFRLVILITNLNKFKKGGENMLYEVLTDVLAIILLVILYEMIRKSIKNKRKGGESDE